MFLQLILGRTRARYRCTQAEVTLVLLVLILFFSRCDTVDPPPSVVTCSETLSQSEVQTIIAHAVEQARRVNQKVIVAVSDREGNILGVFRITGARLESAVLMVSGTPVQIATADTAIRKARTAAFLSRKI